MQKIHNEDQKLSVVRLSGGLGNQLFQYAFSNFIERQYGIVTQLDLDSYSFSNRDDDRYPLINKLNIANKKFITSTPFLYKFMAQVGSVKLKKFLLKKREITIRDRPIIDNFNIVREGNCAYDKGIVFDSNKYYIGNFISPAYWQKYDEVIVDEIREQIMQYSKSMGQARDSQQNAYKIAIHARRGDYIANPKTKNFHGYCTTDFYIEAVKRIIHDYSNVKGVVIASDSKKFAIELGSRLRELNLEIDFEFNKEPIIVLRNLMKFKYFIGSNSTLSWWASTLGVSEVSIFPKNWFVNSDYSFNNSNHYIKIPILLDIDLSID